MSEMRNQDTSGINAAISNALENGDLNALAGSIVEWQRGVETRLLNEAEESRRAGDADILASRGVSRLTGEETKYYNTIIAAARTNGSGAQNAITNIDIAMPRTILDRVMDDIAQNHPLLEAINFENITGIAEIILNNSTKQLASWGSLTSAITKEITAGITKIAIGQKKLSAFFMMPKSMLDLGAVWIDRYIRELLYEALAFGLEEAIINGTGNGEPIGMIRMVGTGENRQGGITLTNGVFPAKTVVAITDLSPKTYGGIISTLATAPNGETRAVNEVLMIVNPVDYFNLIMPATTALRPEGTYANNVLPWPTKIIQSASIAKGKAILGIGDRYFMGVGMPKDGRIEYADQYKFLEDERTYLIKLYGEGQPKDNNAFVYADISGVEALSPMMFNVSVTTPTSSNDGGAVKP
ncbi:MAG: phage major capsid protein [Clostridia bacterium]